MRSYKASGPVTLRCGCYEVSGLCTFHFVFWNDEQLPDPVDTFLTWPCLRLLHALTPFRSELCNGALSPKFYIIQSDMRQISVRVLPALCFRHKP